MRILRTAVLVLAVIVLLVPATAYCVVYFLANSPVGQAQVQARLSAALPNAQVTMADLELDARPLGVHVHGLDLKDKAGAPVLEAGHLEVAIDYRHILEGRRQIDRIHLDDFELHLTFDESGTLVQSAAFQQPGGAEEPKPDEGEPAQGGELSDVVLSDGTLDMEGPGWTLDLAGTQCAGRVKREAALDANVTCSWAAGKLVLLPPILPEPLELSLGQITVRSLEVQNDGKRVALDGLRFEIDGRVLEGSLHMTQVDGVMLPTLRLALRGDLAPSLTRLATAGHVTPHGGKLGGLHFDLDLHLTDDAIELKVGKLDVQGQVQLPDGTLTGLAADEVSFSAKKTGQVRLGVTNARVAELTQPDVQLFGARVSGAVTLEFTPEGVMELVVLAMFPDPTLEPPAPTSMHVQLDSAALQRMVSDGVTVEELALGAAHLSAVARQGGLQPDRWMDDRVSLELRLDGVSAKRFVRGATTVEGATLSSAEFGLEGLKGTVRLDQLLAERVQHGEEAFLKAALSADLSSEAWPRILLRKLELRTAGLGGLALQGETTVDLFAGAFPTRLEAKLTELAGPRLASFIPADHPLHAALLELLAGSMHGDLIIEGDAGKPNLLAATSGHVRVQRVNDHVELTLADKPLRLEPDSLFEMDKRRKRLRVGQTTLSVSVITPKRER